MKIAWFTPFNERSAIGKVGLQTCEYLSREHEVDIWCYETKDTLDTQLNVIHFDPSNLSIDKLEKYDHVIYNMGNYAGYHWAIYDAMLRYPGILVLHDRTMHGFYRQYFDLKYGAGSQESNQAFMRLMRDEYGSSGENALHQYNSADVITMNEIIVYYSFLRKMCSVSIGVFTHSAYFAEAIKEYVPVPTGYAYLPCMPGKADEMETASTFVRDKKKLLMVSNGIVHPVKHIKEMTDVLLEDKTLRDKIQYVVIGDCGGEYGERLKALSSGELKNCLYILGYQSYKTMNTLLREADICVNLRYPNSEACSLSLLEQMSYEKPVIVYNSGIYGEVPDGAVYKIEIDSTGEQLKEAVRILSESEDKRKAVGKKALDFIQKECTLEKYCNRLNQFLKSIPAKEYKAFNDRILSDMHDEMAYLGYNYSEIPEAMDDISVCLGQTLNAQENNTGAKDTIAFWIAFPYTIEGLHREGVMKLNARLAEALADRYPNLNIEIWTYETNKREVEISFQKLISVKNIQNRTQIITEKNWMNTLCVPQLDKNMQQVATIEADNLGIIARKYSQACVFIPVILYLDNVLQAHRPVYVPAMDMSVKYYYEEFTYRDSNRKFTARDTEGRVDRMFRRGMGGYCMSQPIKDTQILPLLRNAREDKIGIVWTPDMTSVKEGEYSYSKKILEKYGISQPYLFYPTQFRPNKNIGTLLNAFEILIKSYPELKMVFTGKLEDLPDLQKQWKSKKAINYLIFVCDLSEEELFTLYHYAACVPVTTIMEGGFPAQAIEALKMNTPVVLGNISVVQERLQGCGMTDDNCGIALFAPYDETALADQIAKAIDNPESFRKGQSKFWRVFSKYTWKEAAEKHFQLIMNATDF